MSVSRDIVATWRRPREVMRRLLAQGRREDRALAFLIGACFLIFVAQWPRISREAYFAAEGDAPLQARLAITFFAMLMIWPLMAYALGALTHLVARLVGGRGTWYSARLALFWALLASTPAWLLHGLVAGFIGPGPAQNLVGALLLLAFLAIWGICLGEAERGPEAETAP
ncbi:YIP1 family protein [Roseicyclus sp.]|uniref:YIP1 family protein n=1 Tax=Roseicyclus sp. TaxID=1914329 RepID=UPI003FA0A3F3